MNKRSFLKNAIALTAGLRLGLTAKAEEPTFTYPLPDKKGPSQSSDLVKGDIIGIYDESTRKMKEEYYVRTVSDDKKHVGLEEICRPDTAYKPYQHRVRVMTMDDAKVKYVKVCSSI